MSTEVRGRGGGNNERYSNPLALARRPVKYFTHLAQEFGRGDGFGNDKFFTIEHALAVYVESRSGETVISR
jgi:hypothetical protein